MNPAEGVVTHICTLGGLLGGHSDGKGLVCVHGYTLRPGDQIRDEWGTVYTVGDIVPAASEPSIALP